MKLYPKMRTYQVPMRGRVDLTFDVIAQSKGEAIEMAYKEVRELNMKNKVYINFYYDTEADECNGVA